MTVKSHGDMINELTQRIYQANVDAGWWTDLSTGLMKSRENLDVVLAKIALMHSELSEATEGIRKGKMDDHLPHRPMGEVEFADAIIRIIDTAGFLGYDLGGAIEEKLAYNAQRADHKIENRLKEGGKKA